MKNDRNVKQLLKTHRFITDGGLETTMIFIHDIKLPEFAAFPLLNQPEHQSLLREYYISYITLARKNSLGFILESPTWRASRSWGEKLGYGTGEIDFFNRKAISFLESIRQEFEDCTTPMIISGNLGPRGDGYHADDKMTSDEARSYHSAQIGTFSRTTADIVSAFTITYAQEAIGITLAARDAGIPATISFTVETDGRLPSGQPLGEAILEVDEATDEGPLYYMINCAHPTHFKHILTGGSSWLNRIRAIRANASCKSHAELDEAVALDRGNPSALGQEYAILTDILPHLNVFGGCCGTDHLHIEAICREIVEPLPHD